MRAALVAVAVALAGCAPERPAFVCTFWTDCGPGGACEPHRACSFPDPACETGRRFGELSAPELAGECVDFVPAWTGVCDADHPCTDGTLCRSGRCIAVEALAAGGRFTAVQCVHPGRAGGDVWAWGLIDLDGIPNTNLEPANLLALNNSTPARSVTVGVDHVCITAATGSRCVGANSSYQLGNTNPLPQVDFALTPADYDVLAAGPRHTCGIRASNGDVQCWGDSTQAQLDGMLGGQPTAVPVTVDPFPGSPVERLAAAEQLSCAASADAVACWGTTTVTWAAGTVGTGAPLPVELLGLDPGTIDAIDVGLGHGCVIKGGDVWCWGANNGGQVTGAVTGPAVATRPLPAGTGAIGIATGASHSCAVTGAGEVWCWGDGAAGQLGPGAIGPAPVRVLPDAPPALGPIAAGDNFTCAMFVDSLVRCWGASEAVAGRELVLPCTPPPPA